VLVIFEHNQYSSFVVLHL